VAVVLLVLGAVILIGLVFQGRGALTDWILNVIAPWFGSGRWLLPLVLIGLGVWLERAGGVRAGWLRTLAGSAIAYAAALALIALLADGGMLDGRSGGRIGAWLASVVGRLVSPLGASVVFVGVLLAGLVIALDRPVRELLAPFGRGARGLGSALAAPAASAGAAAIEQARRSRAEPAPLAGSGATVRDGRSARDAVRPEIPSPFEQPAQVSSVFAGPPPAPITGERMTLFPDGAATAPGRIAVAEGSPGAGGPVGGGAGVAAAPVRREYRLPPMTLLDDAAPRMSSVGMDHAHNAAIIMSKLASFNIPSKVTRWNAGPVVTQYEVEPDPSIKVSRIEALADDLAMALAARTIRIEAPIPGRQVVGLEIPNMDFNVVAIRQILEHPDVSGNPSPIAFALGRDVAGHPRAADLAKMPHLLIAGATGSGKSVMVNALITSLLMRATPDDVRLILVDPKRVELADYNGMPHLLVPVITEADRAIAALKWAVAQMELRYRKFAGATARNIASYNETRADPADRLPYIVIIVDELADLMMRKGQTVEDPIVRLAQKARATGIHLVLATQRPSVNVVTGLIKANFPSRIAFAMASQIDSRTILDAPGAEDLIGRGDMLFQPSDLPRPIRLQGVFVADREIRAVTSHWRAEAEPHYDLGIIEDEEESTGSVDDLADDDADRLLREAVGVVQEYDRASASLLQRRLKIGYARAARIIDQLEARGYIGPFDGSNARQVLRREASAGVAPADVDDGDER
jgi:S-DNA-T family DNA segregation ATPase FtsK/SpoIIIE